MLNTALEDARSVDAEHSFIPVAKEKPRSPLADILDPPWINSWKWPLDFLAAAIIGSLLGVLAFPFVKVVYEVPLWWLRLLGPEGFPDHPSSLAFANGSPSWILVCWLGGTCVGLLKAIVGLDGYASFVQEVKTQHVEPLKALKVFLCCGASLCCTVSMGPEAGLAAMGGAIGHVLAHVANLYLAKNSTDSDLRQRTYILCGLSSAFGATFPSPFSAILLVGEIATSGTEEFNHGQIMGSRRLSKRALGLLVPAATVAYGIRSMFAPSTPLGKSLNWQDVPYDKASALISMGLAFVAAFVGLTFILIWEATKSVMFRLGACIERWIGDRCGKPMRIICLASIGGLGTGGIIVLFPMCYGCGFDMIEPMNKMAPQMTLQNLVGACVAKCFAWAMASSGGFVGGMFFPLMYAGLLAGEACAMGFNLDRSTCVPFMMAAVPASVITAPLAMVALPCGMFIMNPQKMVPIFLGVIMSNQLLLGTGLLHLLLNRRPGVLSSPTASLVAPQSLETAGS